MARSKGVYKRGEVWWIRYAGPGGKMIYESTKLANCKEAEELLILKKKEVLDGKDPAAAARAAKTGFGKLAAHYLEWAARQRSFRSKKFLIQRLVDTFGEIPLSGFTTRLVEEYQTSRLNDGRKPATVNRELSTLKHMFTKANEWEMLGDEGLRRIRKVRKLQEHNARLRYLSAEECQTLAAACDPHLHPVIVTAINTGMRREEILSLEWEKHIDLKHGFILLDRTKNGDRREIPINRTLRETLQALSRRIDTPYVFTDREGNRFKSLHHSFASACRRAGIKDFRFHDLRHTFASRLVMSGADIAAVRELLGHKSLQMTLRYAHLAPSHKVAAIFLLDGDPIQAAPQNYTKTIQSVVSGKGRSA